MIFICAFTLTNFLIYYPFNSVSLLAVSFCFSLCIIFEAKLLPIVFLYVRNNSKQLLFLGSLLVLKRAEAVYLLRFSQGILSVFQKVCR
jgi:hypothetical protein